MDKNTILDLAYAFRNAKPWKRIYEQEPFAITLPDGQIGYCCLMGRNGEHMALSLYIGAIGFSALRRLHEMKPDATTAERLTMDCIQCLIYTTEYVIWNNFDREFEAPDLQAYKLSAHLLKQLDFSGGAVTRLHQSVAPTEEGEDYLSKLELLEYDVFYGEQHSFEGKSPYIPTEMRLGRRPITITEVSRDFHRLLVTGEGFTEYSRIVPDDGQPLETLLIDDNHIIARFRQGDGHVGSLSEDANLERIAVAQINSDGVELSRTDGFEVG